VVTSLSTHASQTQEAQGQTSNRKDAAINDGVGPGSILQEWPTKEVGVPNKEIGGFGEIEISHNFSLLADIISRLPGWVFANSVALNVVKCIVAESSQ
jgi:hypothetical protein